MTHIPTKLLHELLERPEYSLCMLYGYPGHVCHGRITFDHAIIVAGKQVQKRNCIISLCAKGHSVNEFQYVEDHKPEVSLWIALNRMTMEELDDITIAVDYRVMKERLNVKYGSWQQRYPDYWSPN